MHKTFLWQEEGERQTNKQAYSYVFFSFKVNREEMIQIHIEFFNFNLCPQCLFRRVSFLVMNSIAGQQEVRVNIQTCYWLLSEPQF